MYVFYDPDFEWLEPGKYTALREIQWAQRAHAVSPRLRYYYMGYYIHECPKMRYKGEYEPSELRCWVGRCWVPLSSARAALAVSRCAWAAAGAGGGAESGVARARSRRSLAPSTEEGERSARAERAALSAIGSRTLLRLRNGQLCGVTQLRADGQRTVAAILDEFGGFVGPAVLARAVVQL